jgi:hypothetical protein
VNLFQDYLNIKPFGQNLRWPLVYSIFLPIFILHQGDWSGALTSANAVWLLCWKLEVSNVRNARSVDDVHKHLYTHKANGLKNSKNLHMTVCFILHAYVIIIIRIYTP